MRRTFISVIFLNLLRSFLELQFNLFSEISPYGVGQPTRTKVGVRASHLIARKINTDRTIGRIEDTVQGWMRRNMESFL